MAVVRCFSYSMAASRKTRDVYSIAYAISKNKTKSEECGIPMLNRLHIQTYANILRTSTFSPFARVLQTTSWSARPCARGVNAFFASIVAQCMLLKHQPKGRSEYGPKNRSENQFEVPTSGLPPTSMDWCHKSVMSTNRVISVPHDPTTWYSSVLRFMTCFGTRDMFVLFLYHSYGAQWWEYFVFCAGEPVSIDPSMAWCVSGSESSESLTARGEGSVGGAAIGGKANRHAGAMPIKSCSNFRRFLRPRAPFSPPRSIFPSHWYSPINFAVFLSYPPTHF